MASYQTQQLIWGVTEEQVTEVASAAPGRIHGLFGINPREGMDGVRRLDRSVKDGPFIGALGRGLPAGWAGVSRLGGRGSSGGTVVVPRRRVVAGR